ncbi:hypothetical protein V494_06089 [Pseudogymnoascus sp. VKM F-4513 (FW-928)]|nr:hypothetical protein V494_06089 [Pseudogymnoascus sp. VKM F-4513 (FW-928)]
MDTTTSHFRDGYDLCYKRELIGPPTEIESLPQRVHRKAISRQLRALDTLSLALRFTLQRNDSLISAISIAAHHLSHSAASPLPLRPHLPPRPSRPDTNTERDAIYSRHVAAQHTMRILSGSLKQLNVALLRIPLDPAHSPLALDQTTKWPRTFYLITHSLSPTPYDSDLGFYSARGLPRHDFRAPSDTELESHRGRVGNNENRASKVVHGFQTPFIPLYTNASWAYNFASPMSGVRIHVIDSLRLQQLGVVVEPCPRDGGEASWVARFWVPVECVGKRCGFGEFVRTCGMMRIVDDHMGFSDFGRELLEVAIDEELSDDDIDRAKKVDGPVIKLGRGDKGKRKALGQRDDGGKDSRIKVLTTVVCS